MKSNKPKTKTQTELVEELANRTGIDKTKVKTVLDANAVMAIEELNRTDGFSLIGFGKLDVKTTKQRIGRNPRTGAGVTIPPRRKVIFRPGKLFKQAIEN